MCLLLLLLVFSCCCYCEICKSWWGKFLRLFCLYQLSPHPTVFFFTLRLVGFVFFSFGFGFVVAVFGFVEVGGARETVS